MGWISDALEQGKKQAQANISAGKANLQANLGVMTKPVTEAQKFISGALLRGENNPWGAGNQGVRQSAMFTGAGTPWAAGNQNTWWDYARGFGTHTNPAEIAGKYKAAKQKWDEGDMGAEDYIGLSLQGGHGASLDFKGTERENAAANARAAIDAADRAANEEYRIGQAQQAEQQRIANERTALEDTGRKQAAASSLAEAMISGLRKKRGRVLWG